MDNFSITAFIVLITSFVIYVSAAAMIDKKKKTDPMDDFEDIADISAVQSFDVEPLRYCGRCMTPINGSVSFCPSCGAAAEQSNLPHQLPVGTVIDKRYRIGCALGESSSVITYAARDDALESPVCVREYFPADCADREEGTFSVGGKDNASDGVFETGKKRFVKDMRFLGSISANTAALSVRDIFSANGTVYAVTDYFAGKTLSEKLASSELFSEPYAMALFIPLLRLFAQEEKNGLLRLNITPDNISFFDDRLLPDTSASRGGNISAFPKAGYAPEELYRKSGSPGSWTDVYSVCAVIYRCLTGIEPDEASDRVYKDTLRSPSSLGAVISPAFENAVMKGLGVYKENRWQNCGELLDAVLSGGKPAGGSPFINPIIDPVNDGIFHSFADPPREPEDNDII